MPLNIENTWVYRFHDMLHLTYQQKGSMLENLLDRGMIHRDVHAAIDHHERLGNIIANDTVTPFGATVIVNPEHSRRAAVLKSSDAAILVSDEHTLRAMVNPTNGYTNTIVYALGRRADLHIINAAVGAASVATTTPATAVIGYTTAALPAGHVIGGGTAMDLARIISAAELLSKASCPNGRGERIMLYSPGQLRDILAITQASSSDFTKNLIHDRGTINGLDWEGFHWIEVPDVVDPGLTTLQVMLPLAATVRSCVAFHKSAIGLSIGREITTRINERPDLSNSIQIRSVMMQAAVRVWEAGVVIVNALEN